MVKLCECSEVLYMRGLYGNYNRILLSPVLCGEKAINDIMLNDEQWYKDNNVTLHKGVKVTMSTVVPVR